MRPWPVSKSTPGAAISVAVDVMISFRSQGSRSGSAESMSEMVPQSMGPAKELPFSLSGVTFPSGVSSGTLWLNAETSGFWMEPSW